jgi:hydroxyacylglutathione hydrolase
MRITQVPCLADNVAYLVTCSETGKTAVVDPSDGPRIASEVKRLGLDLVAILSTHHHFDHTGGNAYLWDRFLNLSVYASVYDKMHERVERQTHAVAEGDCFSVGKLAFSVLDIPGHTLGQVAYVTEESVFTGDTLFIGGCGRIFEGTPAMMMASLLKLRALPDETLIYCGHEYTQKNLEFALSLEPDNTFLKERLAIACDLRAKGLSTIPSSMKEERPYNPFLRCDDPAFKRAVERQLGVSFENSVALFAEIRALKDRF